LLRYPLSLCRRSMAEAGAGCAGAAAAVEVGLVGVLRAVLALDVRRALKESLVRAAVETAARSAVEAATCEPILRRHEGLQAATGRAAVQLQRDLVAVGQRPLARRVQRQACARHAAAHPDLALIPEVLKALAAHGESSTESDQSAGVQVVMDGQQVSVLRQQERQVAGEILGAAAEQKVEECVCEVAAQLEGPQGPEETIEVPQAWIEEKIISEPNKEQAVVEHQEHTAGVAKAGSGRVRAEILDKCIDDTGPVKMQEQEPLITRVAANGFEEEPAHRTCAECKTKVPLDAFSKPQLNRRHSACRWCTRAWHCTCESTEYSSLVAQWLLLNRVDSESDEASHWSAT